MNFEDMLIEKLKNLVKVENYRSFITIGYNGLPIAMILPSNVVKNATVYIVYSMKLKTKPDKDTLDSYQSTMDFTYLRHEVGSYNSLGIECQVWDKVDNIDLNSEEDVEKAYNFCLKCINSIKILRNQLKKYCIDNIFE